jgi:hypothetical protein
MSALFLGRWKYFYHKKVESTNNHKEGVCLPESVMALGLLSEQERQGIMGVGKLPTAGDMQLFCGLPVVKEIYLECGWDRDLRRRRLVGLAQKYLAHNSPEMALRAVVLAGRF